MFGGFGAGRGGQAPIDWVRSGLIGENVTIDDGEGPKRLIYTDYVASGRALRQIEDYIAGSVLPFYANTHSETSYCGAYMTRLREEGRTAIARHCQADDDCAVVFAGSGATAGFNRLVSLLGAGAGESYPVVVLHGPYEHHSNLLPWRESGTKVIEVPESVTGGPDLDVLETLLVEHAGRRIIGAFSACSNVTGILTPVEPVTTLLKAHGALAVWDYACAAPYVPIAMVTPSGAALDAVVFSPHKFIGGPAASGIMIVRRSAVRRELPTWPGGGTVAFVAPWAHDYSDEMVEREEAGTPNVVGDIRAALALEVKALVGTDTIERREAELNTRALAAWQRDERMVLLGADKLNRLPIFSMLVRHPSGGWANPNEIARLLSRRYGIQARGGCSCAGPYGHRLLGIDRERSEVLRAAVRAGELADKPGWVRLNFSYVMTNDTADYVIGAVQELVDDIWRERVAVQAAVA